MKKWIALFVSILLLTSVTVFAAQSNVDYVIPKGEVRNNIVFGAGQTFSNSGTVNDDIFAAGRAVTNEGTVNGDMFVAAQNAMINGTISGSIRALAETINVSARVDRNVLAAGRVITLEKAGTINGSMNAAGQTVTVNGVINKGFNAAGASVFIDGTVTGDVYIEADNITVTPNARIDGNLSYKSSKEANIPAGVVTGKINKNITPKAVAAPKEEKPFSIGNIISKLLWIISSFLLGALLIKLFERFFTTSSDTIKTSWGKYLGIGFLTLIIVPIAVLMLLVTIIGIPIGLVSLVIYFLFLYLAKIPVSIFVGGLLLKDKSIYLKLLLGLVILGVIYLIPYLGGITSFAVILTGLGTLVYNIFFPKKEVVAESVE